MDNLAAMGYQYEWRRRILATTLTGYMRSLKKCKETGDSRNRFGDTTFKKRRFQKCIGNQEWFRPQLQETELPTNRSRGGKRMVHQDSRYIEAVFFVPHTPEGVLRGNLMKMENGLCFKTKIKYVEEQGMTLSNTLVRKDPFPTHCGRAQCFPCRSAPGKCTRQGALYKIECITCKEEVEAGDRRQETHYYGESARTLFDRGLEHLKALGRRDKESPLWDHHQEVHSTQ